MRFFLILLLIWITEATVVHAADVVSVDQVDTAEVYHSEDPDKRIPGLAWDSDPLPIEREQLNDDVYYRTALTGKFITPYQKIRYRIENSPIQELDADQPLFRIPVSLTSSKLKVQFWVVKDERTSYTEIIYIRSTLNELKNRFLIDLGLAYTLLDYEETLITQFKIRELAVTPKVGVTYRLSSRFELNVGGFITAVPIALRKSPDEMQSSRFYGLNGRIGYRLWEFSKKARLYLMPGWYFWGQMVPGDLNEFSYGVSSLGGPQLFLAGRFTTNANRHWYAYLKWAAIQDGQGWNSNNREASAGLGFQVSDPFSSRYWMLTFDLSQAKYSGNKSGEDQRFQLYSASLGVSTNL